MLGQLQMNNEPQLNPEAELNTNNLTVPRPVTNQRPQADNSLNNPRRPLGPFTVDGAGRASTGAIPRPLPPLRIPSTPCLNREMVLSSFITNCNTCRQRNQAVARCYECSSYLCERCVQQHSRSRTTSGHTTYHWCPLSWSSSAVRFPPRHVIYTEPQEGQPNQSNVPEPSGSAVDQPVTAPQPPPRSRAVGAERRSTGENSPSYSLSDPAVPDFQNRGNTGNSPESTVQELLSNMRVSSSYGSELSVTSEFQLISPGPSSGSRSDPDRSPPHCDSLEDQGACSLDAAMNEMSPCSSHLQPLRFHCNSCLLPVCVVCVTKDHATHAVVHIKDALPIVPDVSKKLIQEINQLTVKMRSSLDRMQYSCEKIEYRAYEMAINIKCTMRKLATLLEAREDHLMRSVNQIRLVKSSVIWRQMENVQEAYTKMTESLVNLNNMDTSDNYQQKMMAVHEAAKAIWEIKNMHETFIPLENDAMKFVNPVDELLLAISTLGELKVQTAPMSRSVALCSSPSSYFTYQVGPPSNPMPLAKSRAIHGCNEIVAIKDYGRTPRMVFGRTGSGEGEFCRPWGITINRFGHLLVADRSNSRIQVLDTKGTFIMEFGTRGSGKGQFERPSSVAVSPNDDLVVADKDNHRIQVFNRYGEFLHTFGEKGSLIGQFLYPWDVACNKQGHIAVADARNHRIQLFHWNGVFITLFGGELNQTIPRLFDTPRGVTFDPQGNIMMTDFNLHRVLIINPQTGKVRIVGREGRAKGCFNRPQGIFCDDRGWFVVADSRNYRCQVFNEIGELMWTVGVNGAKYPGEFDRPSSVCVDPEGHLYIMDFGNDRIQIF